MKTLKMLKPYLKGSYGLAVVSLIFALASVAAKMAIPLITGTAIDQISNGNYQIAPYLFACLGCLVAGAGFRYFFDFTLSLVSQRVIKRMRDELYEAINALPVSYLDTHRHGDILLRLINDIENVQTGLISGAGALFEGVVQIAITIAFMFVINWLLAVSVIVLTPISIFVSRLISRSNSRFFKSQNKKLGELTAFSLESIHNIEAIKALGIEEERSVTFDAKNQEVKSSNFKANFAASWINPSTRLVNNSIYAVLVLIGAFLLLQDVSWAALTVGGLSSFLTYAYQYMSPFNEVSNVASEILYATTSFSRIHETITAPKDIDEGTLEVEGKVEKLSSVDTVFSYDGKRIIIKDFNLEVSRGQKIALVGPTGCGKTTVINILMRFYDPQKGGFYFNGIPTLDLKKHEMRSHIGMVLQETFLIHGTIKENIAFSKKDASMEEIIAAAKKAHAHGFIKRLENGYDTVVSNASGLSMGEKQLLCVARIMLAEPEIILLDEATSSIDLRTELKLSKAFDELMEGKTSIVVAHRLSTIKNADVILYMKDGEVLERGNFADLMKKDGYFATLYRSQLG